MNSVLLDTNERRKRVGLRTPEERIVVEERETARRWKGGGGHLEGRGRSSQGSTEARSEARSLLDCGVGVGGGRWGVGG